MIVENLLDINTKYSNVINWNSSDTSTLFIQKTDYVTIFYDKKPNTEFSYIDKYPIHIDVERIDDSLANNIIKGKETHNNSFKYIASNISENNINIDLNSLKSKIYANFPILERSKSQTYRIFRSMQNIFVNPHYDLVDRVLIQLEGTKKVCLLSPEYIKHFDEFPLLHPADRNLQTKSIFDNDVVKPHIKEYMLIEGDSIYIPQYWIHEISTPSESSSLVLSFNDIIHTDDIYSVEKQRSNLKKSIIKHIFDYGGMDSVMKWNHNLIYNNCIPVDMTYLYKLFEKDLISTCFKNELDIILIELARSFKIFFSDKGNIYIPRF